MESQVPTDQRLHPQMKVKRGVRIAKVSKDFSVSSGHFGMLQLVLLRKQNKE